jgi:TPR repeat protein
MVVIDRLFSLASPAAALRRAIRLSEQERFTEAFPLLTQAAKAGIPDAEYRVARSYLEGLGVPASPTEGARWLQRAASHGCVEAQSLLSALYVHGIAGVTAGDQIDSAPRANRLFIANEPAAPDFEAALKWPPKRDAQRGKPCSAIS